MNVRIFLWINFALCCISAAQGENVPDQEVNPEDAQVAHDRAARSTSHHQQQQRGRKLVQFSPTGEEVEVHEEAIEYFPTEAELATVVSSEEAGEPQGLASESDEQPGVSVPVSAESESEEEVIRPIVKKVIPKQHKYIRGGKGHRRGAKNHKFIRGGKGHRRGANRGKGHRRGANRGKGHRRGANRGKGHRRGAHGGGQSYNQRAHKYGGVIKSHYESSEEEHHQRGHKGHRRGAESHRRQHRY